MKLTGINLNNFGVYYEKHSILFDKPTKNRHIWLFEGLNGAGKTTIFLALIWALYGDEGVNDFTRRTNAEAKETIDLISRRAMAEGKPYMGVEVYFEHDHKKWTLTRRVIPKKPFIKSPGDFDTRITLSDGGPEEKFPQAKVLEILPRDVSQFFFFDGEQVRRYAEPTTKETREAIEHVLGVPVIRDAATDVRRVSTEINRELQRIQAKTQGEEELAELLNSENALTEEIEKLREELNHLKIHLAELQKSKDDLETRLEGLKAVKELMERKRGLQREIELDNHRLEDLIGRKNELKQYLPFMLIRNPLKTSFERFKSKRNDQDINVKKEHLQLLLAQVNDLITEGRCICGTKIGIAEKATLNRRASLYSGEITRIDELLAIKIVPSLAELSRVLGIAQTSKADFKGVDSKIALVELETKKREQEISRLERQIRESEVSEAMKLQNQLDKVNDETVNVRTSINLAERSIESKTKELNDKKIDIRNAKSLSPTIESLRSQFELSERVADALREIIEKLLPAKRAMIEKAASEALELIAHKKIWEGIRINDDFSIEVVNRNEEFEAVSGSAGENEVIALSLILGLKQAADKEAPVIADFLFGKLDPSHRTNLIEALPSFGNQIIVFKIQDAELNGEQMNRLKDLSAGEFRIEFNEKTQNSHIERVKSFV